MLLIIQEQETIHHSNHLRAQTHYTLVCTEALLKIHLGCQHTLMVQVTFLLRLTNIMLVRVRLIQVLEFGIKRILLRMLVQDHLDLVHSLKIGTKHMHRPRCLQKHGFKTFQPTTQKCGRKAGLKITRKHIVQRIQRYGQIHIKKHMLVVGQQRMLRFIHQQLTGDPINKVALVYFMLVREVQETSISTKLGRRRGALIT